jgi:hypothetical protein
MRVMLFQISKMNGRGNYENDKYRERRTCNRKCPTQAARSFAGIHEGMGRDEDKTAMQRQFDVFNEDGASLCLRRGMGTGGGVTPTAFLRTVLSLWGDHWQQPCIAYLAQHGHRYSRQQLWNWKTGNSPVPESVELILANEKKARGSVG